MQQQFNINRPPLSADDLPAELLAFARETTEVSEKQVGIFRDRWERHHGAPPSEQQEAAFKALGKAKASTYIDVLIGRATLSDEPAQQPAGRHTQ